MLQQESQESPGGAAQPTVAIRPLTRLLNSAEQPATRDNTEGSVEQSAHPAPIKTLVDLRHWVENLHEADRRTSPVCRVRDAFVS